MPIKLKLDCCFMVL